MGRTTRSEEDVVKLVHPGKHIEVYTKPIPASEVLKNYPKFCITRPDVFKFPWIVVRHDSVLVPGKVFYLVPKRTLYRLLKANQPPDRSLPLPSSSSLYTSLTISRPPSSNSPLTKNAGMTPKHQTDQLPQRQSLPLIREDSRRRGRKNSHIDQSWAQPLSSDQLEHHKRKLLGKNNIGRCDKRKITSLRSCMRKPGSAPRLANPRVRLLIPGQDIVEPVTKQRTIVESLSRLATSLVVDTCR